MWATKTAKTSSNKISPQNFFKQKSLYESYHWDEASSSDQQTKKGRADPSNTRRTISTTTYDKEKRKSDNFKKKGIISQSWNGKQIQKRKFESSHFKLLPTSTLNSSHKHDGKPESENLTQSSVISQTNDKQNNKVDSDHQTESTTNSPPSSENINAKSDSDHQNKFTIIFPGSLDGQKGSDHSSESSNNKQYTKSDSNLLKEKLSQDEQHKKSEPDRLKKANSFSKSLHGKEFASKEFSSISIQSMNTPNGVAIELKGNGECKHPYDLSKFIRKRKCEARVDTFGKSSDSWFNWTAPLSQRIRIKNNSEQTDDEEQNKEWEAIKENFKEARQSIEIWGSWLKAIEGQQGTGVVSYFVFLKWLLFLNIYLFVIVLAFIVFPPVAFSAENSYTDAVTSTGLSSVSTNHTDVCSATYSSSVAYSTTADDVIQDFFQGTGWMENTAMFYGWYPAKLLSRIDYRMPIAYLMAILGVMLFSLVRMTVYSAAYLRQSLVIRNDDFQTDYSYKVFAGWDYNIYDENTRNLKKRGIYADLVANLDHQRDIFKSLDWEASSRYRLYAVRVAINFLIFGILAACGYFIFWVNTKATKYLNNQSTNGGVVILIVQFLPSVTITILNVMVPIVFGLLIKLENYTENLVIMVTLFRTVFLRLASLAVLIASLLDTFNCSNKEPTCNIGQGDCIPIRCWETYVGQAFYKLMVMDFFVHIIVIFCYELPRKLCTARFGKVYKKLGPAEFDIPKSVLDLIYTQALCWLGCLFCPFITIIAVVNMFTQFYLKLFSALYTTTPPKKPYKAYRTNIFFTIVLIITFLLCCATVMYTMVDIRPSRGCGPFRIYSDMTIALDVCIANSPTEFQTFIDVITARSLVGATFIILCLVIYCLFVWGYGNHSTAERMKQEIFLERKGKHYLIANLSRRVGNLSNLQIKQDPTKLQNGYPDDHIDYFWT